MFIRGVVDKKQVEVAEYNRYSINLDEMVVQERLDGVKLLVLVFAAGENKVMALGPVFDYHEYYHKD